MHRAKSVALKSVVLSILSGLALTACAPQMQRERVATAASARPEAVWAFEQSDIPLEEGYRFGRLPNGMRYVIRQNATPAGTALVRMEVAAGSLDEADSERGFAHFVEHMAFNGSRRVPEGEMVRLLERNGLAFGADNNASTSFEQTTYMLDLPRNDPQLLDVALMLMRETASELTFAPEAVARERGVVLAEMRDRNDWRLQNAQDQADFLYPEARYPDRFPIGTAETLHAATAEALKAFWQREYVPEHTTLIVVGDFDPQLVEAEITEHFASWSPVAAEPQPSAGPVRDGDAGTDIYIDPAIAERVTISSHGAWIKGLDTQAQRRENLLRQIGYGIVNRRLQRLSRQASPPFRGAGLGTSDVFKAGRTTNLIVDTIDAKWRPGVMAAALEYRRALKFGFTEAEVAEQVANIQTMVENAAASSATRSNNAHVSVIFALLRDDVVPSTPESVLERLQAFVPEITPKAVLAALKREVVPLDDPLIRFQGRIAPKGGEAALRAGWADAMRQPLKRADALTTTSFGYTDFGPVGTVISDARDPLLGIRQLRFANGVMLNLKRTALERDRVLVRVSVDGGDMLNTRENPLATQMVPLLPVGGLGKHTQDELQSILAGRTIGAGVASSTDAFVSAAQTTPRDLPLQLQVFAAFIADPAYRSEGEVQYRLNINNFFARLRATPSSALNNAIGGILSDEDPRFTLQEVGDYRALTFAKLKEDIGDRLARGAVEIGIVGDIDEERVIGEVAKTFGALPAREPTFGTYEEQRRRPFTQDRSRRIIHHTGGSDQALLRLSWPTRDDSDPQEALALELLERIVRIELTETLREKLGKAYSPGASSSTSRYWDDYGTFDITASVEVGEVPATHEAVIETVARLRRNDIDEDLLRRARQPMFEAHDNALKSNRGWLGLVDRAQSEEERIERYIKRKERLAALTVADIRALAERYLDPASAVEVLVLPEGAGKPAAFEP